MNILIISSYLLLRINTKKYINNFYGSMYININKHLLDTWLQMRPRVAVPVYTLISLLQCAGLITPLTAMNTIFKRKTKLH